MQKCFEDLHSEQVPEQNVIPDAKPEEETGMALKSIV